jgi:hypothetical protein
MKMHAETKQKESSSESVVNQFEYLHETDENTLQTESTIDPKVEGRITYVIAGKRTVFVGTHLTLHNETGARSTFV